MKKQILFFLVILLSTAACKDTLEPLCGGCSPTLGFESICISEKINALVAANRDFTSVKRYIKANERFWLFDTGAAFDAPQFMLNANCDTVCRWTFRANPPCAQNFNLGDSTAVVLWKK
jgi:hypothetical protein